MITIISPCPPHEWGHAPTVGYFVCAKCREQVEHSDPQYSVLLEKAAQISNGTPLVTTRAIVIPKGTELLAPPAASTRWGKDYEAPVAITPDHTAYLSIDIGEAFESGLVEQAQEQSGLSDENSQKRDVGGSKPAEISALPQEQSNG